MPNPCTRCKGSGTEPAPLSWAAQHVPLLGKHVRVTLNRNLVIDGRLLAFGKDGGVAVELDDGVVYQAWPMLDVEEVKGG